MPWHQNGCVIFSTPQAAGDSSSEEDVFHLLLDKGKDSILWQTLGCCRRIQSLLWFQMAPSPATPPVALPTITSPRMPPPHFPQCPICCPASSSSAEEVLMVADMTYDMFVMLSPVGGSVLKSSRLGSQCFLTIMTSTYTFLAWVLMYLVYWVL